MSWYTLEAAVERGPSRIAWAQWIAAGEVDHYRDGRGRTWVWVDEARAPAVDPRRLRLAFAALERRVVTLESELTGAARSEPAAAAPRTTARLLPAAPASTAPAAAPDPRTDVSPAAPDPERVLDLCAQRWARSDRELERQAGLPKAFLAKAKKGLRGGPKSAASWQRLAAFLAGLERRAAA